MMFLETLNAALAFEVKLKTLEKAIEHHSKKYRYRYIEGILHHKALCMFVGLFGMSYNLLAAH